MASTYTPLGIELMATGENAGTWGTKTNANLNLFEQLSGGFKQVSIAGGADTTALTVADGALTGTAQARMIEFTGTITGNQIVTIPLDVETFYFLKNTTSGAYTVQFKYVSGSGDTFTFATGNKSTAILFATANDGTNPDIIQIQTGGDVVDDTSPQLGGDLDVNGNKIVSTSNGNIELEPNGTGDVILDTDQVTIGGGSEVGQISSNGAYDLKLVTNSNTDSGNITITDGANGDITLTPNGTGDVVASADTVKVGDSGAAAVLTSNGAGTLTVTTGGATDLILNTNSGTNSGVIQITDAANGNIAITPNGSGNIVLDGLTFPNADGSADTFLKTNGSGTLSFAEVSGGTSWQAVKTSNFTAAAGEGYFINTTSGTITMTLPSSPTIGDEVAFVDYAGTFDSNTMTVGRNSEKINGATADLTVSVERAANTLVYTDGTQGWLLKNK